MSFTWQNGRQLASLTKNGSTYNYIYNPDGVRIGKSGAKNVTYEVAGTQILKETIGSTVIYYLYDEKGSPVGLTYNGTDYYYRKNLQGDIIEILDNSKTSVVQYTYNAWGKLLYMSGTLAGTVGVNNGLRYRGYYFDNESSLYYLNSRYYDPSTGRFVNADSILDNRSILGYNVFAYCSNNPVNASDTSGNFVEWIDSAKNFVIANVVQPAINNVKQTFSKINATGSSGVSASIDAGVFDINGGLSISADTSGDVAVQPSLSVTISTLDTTPFSCSVNHIKTISNAPSVDNLNDIGYQFGTSVGFFTIAPNVALNAGHDFNVFPDPNDETHYYYGVTQTFGISSPEIGCHVGFGNTWTPDSCRFNVFDMLDGWCTRIMG